MKPKLMDRISEKDIRKKNVRIAVVGVGYIGLPLAIKFTEKGFSVLGNDVEPEIIGKLRAGKSTIEGITPDRLKGALNKGLKLITVNKDKPAASDPKIISSFIGVDVFIVCVPTPLDHEKGWEPDTSYIEKACDMIDKICQVEDEANKLPEERLLVLESTTYPGTTKEIFSPLLEKFEKHGRQWYLAYSPERTNPGLNAYDDKRRKNKATKSGEEHLPGTFQITRIVGGINEESRKISEALYKTIFKKVRGVENLETAEMIKLVENTFRYTSIAFANEMAIIAKTLGLDVWEIIDAARTKNFGFELCFPGLVGGHCLPIDPHYLNFATRNRRLPTTFVEEAERAHQNMRREAFDLIQRLLNQQNKPIAGTSILFFGVSYKKNVGDIRESAAIKLMKKLHAAGADIAFWDPARARHPAKRRIQWVLTEEEYKARPKKKTAEESTSDPEQKLYVRPENLSVDLSADWESLRNRVLSPEFDCVILATDHDDFHSAYADLITSNDAPPVADLTNAINQWLRHVPWRTDKKKAIKEELKESSKYMLLCVD